MDSILGTIKSGLGISASSSVFDDTIVIHINDAFMILNQLGVGPLEGFRISGSTETWDLFLGTEMKLEGVKTYVLHKVKLAFDTPTNSFLISALEKQIEILEWRLKEQAESPPPPDPIPDPEF